jgi:hypothetical protein
MLETPKMKLEFEAALGKASALHPLRQARERLALELGNLPYNAIRLQMLWAAAHRGKNPHRGRDSEA